MYIPAHFAAPDDDAVRNLLTAHGAADLVTMTERGLVATLLPFVFVPPELCGADRPHGVLHGHVARNNDQWRLAPTAEALVIVRGPDAYVTPTWYATKAEHGRVVPTWNYVTAHVYGELVVHDDAAWVQKMVRTLTTQHEQNRSAPWSVDDAPARYIQGQLRAIVGLELVITRIEAKFKLSQNRSESDIAGVITGLLDGGQTELAVQVARASAAKSDSKS